MVKMCAVPIRARMVRMHHFKILVTALVAMVFGCGSLICTAAVVEVRLPASVEKSAQDGRLLLIFAITDCP